MVKLMSIEEITALPFIDKLGDIQTLTMLYNPETDDIILNAGANDSGYRKLLVESYLVASPEKREDVKTKIKSFPEEISLLDRIIQMRYEKEMNTPESLRQQYARELKMIGNQTAFWDHLDFLSIISKLTKYPELATADAFNWGYIQGIKAERARRKHV